MHVLANYNLLDKEERTLGSIQSLRLQEVSKEIQPFNDAMELTICVLKLVASYRVLYHRKG